MRFVFGVFIVLHGLVHLLYFGQSARYFELKPGCLARWVVGILNTPWDQAARNLASISLVLAALGLVVGGIGIFASQAWWRPVVVGAAPILPLSIFFSGMAKCRI